MTTTVTRKEDRRDVDEKAAIISYQSQLPALIIMKTQKRECVWANFGNVIMGSVYISSNVTQTAYQQFLSNLEMDIKALNAKSIFIADDFNGTSEVRDCNATGKQATLELKLLNTDDTYIGMKWYTDSCNNIGKNKGKIGKEEKAFPRWSYRSLDEEHLEVALITQADWTAPKENESKQLKVQTEVKKVTRQIIDMCNMAMKRVKYYKKTEETDRKKNAYWWNEEINELRQIFFAKGKRFTRANKRKRTLEPDIIDKCQQEYREARKEFRMAIQIAKEKWWKALLSDLNRDLWEEDCKIMVRELKRGAIDNCEILNNKELHVVLGDLFPQENEMKTMKKLRIYSCRKVIIHEIQTALKRLRRKQPASDLDDMMNRIWNQVISQSKTFHRSESCKLFTIWIPEE